MLCEFAYSGLIDILVQAQVMILWGFLDTLTKFLSTVRLWLGSIVDISIFKINIFKIGPFIYPSRYIVSVLEIYCSILLDTFGVAMARYGLILWENGATGSKKVFRCLWGFRDIIRKSKMAAKAQKSKNTVFYRIFLYRLLGLLAGILSIWEPSGILWQRCSGV